MYAGSAPHCARDTTAGWAVEVVAVVADVVVDVAAAALRGLAAGAAAPLALAVALPSERPSTVRWAIGRSALTRTATAPDTVCSAPYVVPSCRSCPDSSRPAACGVPKWAPSAENARET